MLRTNSSKVAQKYTPDVSNMSFVLKVRTEGTKTNITDIPIPMANPELLLSHPKFNKDQPLVFFVSGWKTHVQKQPSKAQDIIAAAFLCRGNINIVVCIYTNTLCFIQILYIIISKYFLIHFDTDNRHRFVFIT